MNRMRSAFRRCAILLLAGLAAMVGLTSCSVNPLTSGKSRSFTFVQLCDPQFGFSDYEGDKESLRQAVRQINALGPDFVVICGDMVHTANNSSYADFKVIVRAFTMPYYCVPGNHDVGNTPTAETLSNYRVIIGDDYYAMDHKGVSFIFTNTQLWKEPVEGESEKQDRWLEGSLKDAFEKGYPAVIVGHIPLFCRAADGPDEYMNLPVEKRAELLKLFEQYKVAAVLGGHAHKLIVNTYQGMQMVNGEATSKNLDGSPLGFRLWHVDKGGLLRHEFVALESVNP